MSSFDPERAVLGAILADEKVLDEIDLSIADFTPGKHRTLWQMFHRMRDKGDTITPITVHDQLPRVAGDVPDLDGVWLADLLGDAATPTSLASRYAQDVANNAGNRRLAQAGQRAIQLAQSGGNAHENQEVIRGEVDRATTHVIESHFIGESIGDTIDRLDQPSRAIPTPWDDLNHIIKGWRPGALYVVGARPSVGKSIFGLQAAMALTEHGAVTFHTLEMGKDELNARAIAQTAEVALGRLDGSSPDTEGLSARDWDRIGAVTPQLLDMPLSVDDRSSVNPTDIKSHARSVARKHKLVGVVVDYLQLMEPNEDDRRRSRQEQVAGFSRQLKLLAKELDVPVIALSQLNRDTTRENRRPTMADLRESGAIEQDSDVVLLLHAEDELSSDLEVIVAKNRHGIKSRALLTRRGEFARLEPRKWTPAHHRYTN